MNKLKYLFFIALFVFISLKYGSTVRGYFAKNTNSILSVYLDTVTFVQENIDEHFLQAQQIKALQSQNKELQESAILGLAHKQELDGLLSLNQMEPHNPALKLVKALSYANLNDYYKVWLDFKDFNASKIYGLIYHDSVAGIVVQKDANPLALLVGDPKAIFSVSIGQEEIPGIVYGKNKELHVRYIPLWMHPQEGDVVITSGMDGIFFKGLKVGVVEKVLEEELSKTAVVQPIIAHKIPNYYHIIDQNSIESNTTQDLGLNAKKEK
ncbi:MAG: rod shape-determining protein MreC [Sulfurospirillum sp.]|nr:rod shape-determining protein MreC [Sulfurospirillum sp.]